MTARDSWLDIWPLKPLPAVLRKWLVSLIEEIEGASRLGGADATFALEGVRRAWTRRRGRAAQQVDNRTAAAAHVLIDLVEFGWELRVHNGAIQGRRPLGQSGNDERERRRALMLVRRDQQLREPSVRAFVRDTEGVGIGPSSVFALMRDGRELVRRIRAMPASDVNAWRDVVAPVVQVVVPNVTCQHTGIPLTDIWRYFRHTWAQPYGSTPGRSVSLLVRDSAAPGWPVMGIAALSSAAARLRERDLDIGWDEDKLVAQLAEHPPRAAIEWMRRLLATSIDEVYRDDLVQDGLIPSRLEAVTDVDDTVASLREEAAASRAAHRRDSEEHKRRADSDSMSEEDWIGEAETSLFRSKRAEEVASLLLIAHTLDPVLHCGEARALADCAASPRGERALKALIRRARARSMGAAIADLSICGAVPPYNELVGSKLVALLAISPETLRLVRDRYQGAVSVIASSMAGRPVSRRSDLVYVSTTSLYGVRPCQYDGAKIPAEKLGGLHGVRLGYRLLANTEGYGSMQFSKSTTEALTRLLDEVPGRRNVHYRFGEGASPRLRGLRDGLRVLGITNPEIMKHEHRRLLYGARLVDNAWQYLLGLDREPRYLFDRRLTRIATDRISDWWFERWVRARLDRPDVLSRIERETLVHPIRHGARVRMPLDEALLTSQ